MNKKENGRMTGDHKRDACTPDTHKVFDRYRYDYRYPIISFCARVREREREEQMKQKEQYRKEKGDGESRIKETLTDYSRMNQEE